MKKIKKRGAVYGIITLLLCIAVYLNWSYVRAPEDLLAGNTSIGQTAKPTESDNVDDVSQQEENYFSTSRLTREQARDEAVSTLKELSEDGNADPAVKEEAAAQISALAEQSVQEANAESLIRAKGYTDAVVMIGDDSVNVVVAPPEGGLQAADVTVIKEVVVSETGVSAGQVKIVEAE